MTIGTLKNRLLLLAALFPLSLYGTLAGGRPNSFSEGQNAFAGVVNPANAVWIKDRIDIGGFWFYQASSLKNKDNSPLFQPGKTDLNYQSKNLFTVDSAIHKQVKADKLSFSLAYFTLPGLIKIRTKKPIPSAGTTPAAVYNRTEAISAIFSYKLNERHSFGIAIDYSYFSRLRKGFQNSDNHLRSVSPGHVTNNGMDHSGGFGLTLGWRWNITNSLNFGAAWTKKSYCGRYLKYRGYEPRHAKNYVPQIFGAGLSYQFTKRVRGRLEVLWSNQGNLPGANNNILSDGRLNLNKRGSKKSPGPGLQDATFINVGIGYLMNSMLSVGAGYSRRIKVRKTSIIISHSYALQTIYTLVTLGANFRYQKHDLFLSAIWGLKNRVKGRLPAQIGGARLKSEKRAFTLAVSWGYLY